MNAFNRCYKTKESRTFVKRKLTALILTLMLVIMLFAAVIVLVFGEAIVEALMRFEVINYKEVYFVLTTVVQFGVFGLLFLLIISSIYWWGPSLDRKWHFFSKGAFLATVLCIAISLGFSAYINNFNSYNKLYGSLGTLIGFMIWLQAMSFTVLLGFEINAGIDLLIRAKKRERLKSKSSE